MSTHNPNPNLLVIAGEKARRFEGRKYTGETVSLEGVANLGREVERFRADGKEPETLAEELAAIPSSQEQRVFATLANGLIQPPVFRSVEVAC